MTIFPMALGISAITSLLLLVGCGQGLAGQAAGEDVEDIGVLKQEVSAISSGLAELTGQIEQIEEAIEVLDESVSDLARSEAIEVLDESVSDLASSVERVLAETRDQQSPRATVSIFEKSNDSTGPPHTQAPPGLAATSSTLLDWHLHREDGGDSSIKISENGSTYAFELWLWSQPSPDAVLSIVSDDTGEVTVSPATLTFTSSNWETAQTVTLTGVDDTDIDGDQTTMVTVSGVGDGWLDHGETVTAVTADDDAILPTSLSVMFDSGVDGEAWGNGTFTRCTATPCGHLDVTSFSGREIYVKVSGHSQDPNDDWYYAYIFMRIEERWEIQFVEPGPYAAHRGIDAENPWGDWGDLTVTANY